MTSAADGTPALLGEKPSSQLWQHAAGQGGAIGVTAGRWMALVMPSQIGRCGEVRGAFGDGEYGGVGVRGGERGHDRRVGHAQPVDAVYP
jgi:hypothetical protein